MKKNKVINFLFTGLLLLLFNIVQAQNSNPLVEVVKNCEYCEEHPDEPDCERILLTCKRMGIINFGDLILDDDDDDDDVPVVTVPGDSSKMQESREPNTIVVIAGVTKDIIIGTPKLPKRPELLGKNKCLENVQPIIKIYDGKEIIYSSEKQIFMMRTFHKESGELMSMNSGIAQRRVCEESATYFQTPLKFNTKRLPDTATMVIEYKSVNKERATEAYHTEKFKVVFVK